MILVCGGVKVKLKKIMFKVVCFSLFFVFSNKSLSVGKPLWEVGVGLGGVYQPYYVGTRQSRSIVFPVPIPIYRSAVFKSDDEGLRAELIKDKRFSLDVSIGFNLAVDSDSVDLRNGLDDVDTQFEIGPSLEYFLLREKKTNVWLNFPFRASFSVGQNGLAGSGFTFLPSINVSQDFRLFSSLWTAKVSLQTQFSTDAYHDIYYGVNEEFVTENRSQFNPGSGYSGASVLFSMRSNNQRRLWVWFLQYDNINDASFENSPLVETNFGLSAGIIYSRYLFKSKTIVRVN